MRRTILHLLGLILGLTLAAGAQEQSVAEAARKAREKKKDQPKATRVFTNDTIPTAGGKVSVVGPTPAPAPDGERREGAEGEAAPAGEPRSDEAMWRKRFADLDTKISQAEKDLDVLQRELSVQQVQYNPDPNVVLREEAFRGKINELRKKVEDKQKEVQQLRQQRTDLEDEMRKAGGNPGWARS